MEFGSGCSEEDQMSKGKLHFSYSSSSSPSSSSSQHKGQRLPLGQTQIYENQPKMGSWFGHKYDPEDDNGRRSTPKLEVMSVNYEEGDKKGESAVVLEKEHMFDKVVTPSDVGKLNRLVIPKQHAERYFPLDSSSIEKGLLLNFEDKSGKAWRFRYSYWNSSQSYVMTKGWSRFVREKKLDAGDIVSFQRGVGELGKEHLYIDWRRRPDAPASIPHLQQHYQNRRSSFPWSPLLMRSPAPFLPRDHVIHSSYPSRNAYYSAGGGSYDCGNFGNAVNPCLSSGSSYYMRSATLAPQQVEIMGMMQWQQGGGEGRCGVVEPMVYESVPVVQGKVAAKRLRLFGVNMDCPITETNECDVLSATPMPHATKELQAIPSSQCLYKRKSSLSLDLDI